MAMVMVMVMVGLVQWIQLVKSDTEVMKSVVAAGPPPVTMMMDRLSFARVVQGLFVAGVLGLIVMKLLRASRMKLPPGPLALPIVGSWLQVCALLDSSTCVKRESMYG
jgi:hypothetical protein